MFVKGLALGIPLLLLVALSTAVAGASVPDLAGGLEREFSGKQAREWGETVTGVRTRLGTPERVLVLTLDACGSPKGKGVDQELLDFLTREQVPATLFLNARWIDANPELFQRLAANPLFTIANHGMWHKPASIDGRSVYGIDGTATVSELVQEIELNARKIEALTGTRTRYYRSGTAYYDEYAVAVARRLGHEVIGFSVLGDAGATYSAAEVEAALLAAQPGEIIIAHMNHPEAGTGAGIIAAVPELRRRGFRFVRLSDYSLE
ncbi:polysaccharide deacetylase family protein [Desulfuromonas carbonis]|uniref:polysaccharide deacetylase family protein n=1 Tax=Desulfuromonas sp. DDH964 TaxID=1823759 RepID=UPI00078B521B|nr:polysaccharide deacetylase family protein [Desulfuromonas sp. DDH964]AMV72724.1 polysaccharide deacetylase domain-containing protein [Desulfuromonas sp. DDH964]